jgi:hypothetical protein
MSTIGSSSPYLATSAQYTALFQSIDTNKDGQVSKAEFVAGAPQGVDGDSAGSLFDILDSGKQGAIDDGELASSFQTLASATESMLIDIQGGGSIDPSQDTQSVGSGPASPDDTKDKDAEKTDDASQAIQSARDSMLDQLMQALDKADQDGTRLASGLTPAQAISQFMKAVNSGQGASFVAATVDKIA